MLRKCLGSILIYGLIFIVFFGIYINRYFNYYQCLAVLCIPLILAVICGARKKKIDAQWKIYIFMVVLSAIFSFKIGESIKYVFMLIVLVYGSFYAKIIKDYREKLVKSFFVFSLFQVGFVFLQYINPSFVNSLNILFYPTEVADNVITASVLGMYSGISGELAFAMLFSSFIYAYGFISYIQDNKKIYLLPLVLGFVSILLNSKRISIVIIVIASVGIYFLYCYCRKKVSIINLASFLVVISLLICILLYTDFGEVLFQKNQALVDSGDITNGRTDLNRRMFDIFLQNPILGIGPFSTTAYTGGDYLGHNIYLSTLAECGILGFLSFVLLLYRNLQDTLKVIIHGDSSKYMYLSLFVQIFFIIYGFTGNPLYGFSFLTTYIIFTIDENRHFKLSSR